MSDDRTTIWISDDLWSELNRRKQRGDTFEDVVWRALDKEGEPGQADEPEPAPKPESREPDPPTDVDQTLEPAADAREFLPDYDELSIVRTDARDDLLLALFAELREQGELEKKDITAWYETHPVELGSLDSWYENLVSPGLRQFPGVTPPKRGGRTWAYTAGEE